MANCALISRSWRYRCQRYIFRQLVFKLEYAYRQQASRIAELMDFPYEVLSCHVRALIINLYDYGTLPFLEDSSWTKKFQKIFSTGDPRTNNSASLELRSCEFNRGYNTRLNVEDFVRRMQERTDWKALPEGFTRLLSDTIHSGNLKRLHLSYFQNIPKYLIELSTLESVGLHSMVFNFDRVPCKGDCVLHDQTSDFDDDCVKVFLLAAFDEFALDPPKLDLSRIQVLRLDLQVPEGSLHATTMLELLSPSLESLKIVVDDWWATRAMDTAPRSKKLKKLTIMNSGKARINFINSHVASISDTMLPLAQRCSLPLDTLDIHITLGSTKKLGGLRCLEEGYVDLDEILSSSASVCMTKVITLHFFLPTNAQVVGLDEDAFEEKVMRIAEAAFPMTIQARASIGPFRIFVDIGTPDINATEACY
ncbi:hypothetical protein CPC08DRAFT_766149 [Agrocybe pediades]|nr:hypothetical protein CPC08DRAFT_766149 [Agrocybe pediades]